MKTNQSKVILLINLILLLALIGCATIVNGGVQVISVNSNVIGAVVQMNGVSIGTTPFTGQVKRGSTNTLSISHPNYQTQIMQMTITTTPYVLGNIITGGFFGTTTDFASGAIYEYAPSTFYVHMLPIELGQNEFLDELQIRKFAMIYHSQIAIDSNNKEQGEYILALADLMNAKMERYEAIETIQIALDKSKGNQLMFGDELIKSFR